MEDEEEKKKSRRKAVLGAVLKVANDVGPIVAYDAIFNRYERPDYTLYPGEYCIERYHGKLTREEFFIPSDHEKLKAYYYPSKEQKGLVVICHGLHAGSDDYLPITKYMVERGFNVLGFDYKGTYDSSGSSTVGMCESLVDLDHVLDFILKKRRFKNQPLFLIGHSWGGYAVTSINAIKDCVRAVAAIAPMNDGFNMIVEKGGEYVGKIAESHKPVLDSYQKKLFGDYIQYNGVKGINARMIPYIIAQGYSDKIITMKGTSIAAHQDEIINPYVDYCFKDGEEGGHDNIWHSSRAVLYRHEVDEQIKELKKDEIQLRSYIAYVDHHLYSEVDDELMNKIANMFENQLVK